MCCYWLCFISLPLLCLLPSHFFTLFYSYMLLFRVHSFPLCWLFFRMCVCLCCCCCCCTSKQIILCKTLSVTLVLTITHKYNWKMCTRTKHREHEINKEAQTTHTHLHKYTHIFLSLSLCVCCYVWTPTVKLASITCNALRWWVRAVQQQRWNNSENRN